MYMRPADGESEALSPPTSMSIALAAAVAVVVLLGIVADPVVRLAQAAGAILLYPSWKPLSAPVRAALRAVLAGATFRRAAES